MILFFDDWMIIQSSCKTELLDQPRLHPFLTDPEKHWASRWAGHSPVFIQWASSLATMTQSMLYRWSPGTLSVFTIYHCDGEMTMNDTMPRNNKLILKDRWTCSIAYWVISMYTQQYIFDHLFWYFRESWASLGVLEQSPLVHMYLVQDCQKDR